MAKRQYAIWWLSQNDCEAIESVVVYGDDDEPRDILAEKYGWPEYIADEFRSRVGRPGRGRLWVPRDIPIKEIPWDDEKPTCKMAAAHCGGIVIHAKDVPKVISLPGFVTDLEMNFWRR